MGTFTPSPPAFPSPLVLYIGTWFSARARAGSHTLDNAVFPTLPGQSAPIFFEPSDVGMPIAIVGAGPVDPDMPIANFIQGGTLWTTIASYVSPTQVTLTDAPTTAFYNTGINNVALYRPAGMHLTSGMEYNSTVASGTRDTLKFSILYSDEYITQNQVVCVGQPVYLTSTDPDIGDVFAGHIDALTPYNEPGAPPAGGGSGNLQQPFRFECQCTSWELIAGKRVVAPQNPTTFTQVAAGEVFKKVCLTNLIDEGITVISSFGSPATQGPLIDLNVPIGAVISDLLDQICQLGSTVSTFLFWYADPNGSLTYHISERTVTPAPWDVDDTSGSDSNVLIQSQIQGTHANLANRAFIIADKMLTGTLLTTFNGDGASQSFSVSQPILAEPVITLNGNPQTVGVQGVDTGKDWYWSQGSTQIVEDPSGPILTEADALQVVYRSSNPGVAVAYNNGGIAERAIVEGPGAIYETSVEVTDPIAPADALSSAQGVANAYGQVPYGVSLKTLRAGLRTGMQQFIQLADIGADGDYLIASIKLTIPNNLLTWEYTAILGANTLNWQISLTNFINRQKNTAGIITPVDPITQDLHAIVIDHTKVAGTDKTDFVLQFSGQYDFLKQQPAGKVFYADGSDIFFTSDAAALNTMSFDLANYDPLTGTIAAWIRIPTLSASVDTTIYIWYGDQAISISRADPRNTWSHLADVSGVPNNNYHGVYHLTEASGAGSYLDSTKYGNDSISGTGTAITRGAGPTTGIFGQTQGGGSGSGIVLPQTMQGNGFANSSGTMEAWVKTATLSAITPIVLAMDSPINSAQYMQMNVIAIRTDDGTTSGSPINDGNWHRIVITLDANRSIYIDGVLSASHANATRAFGAGDAGIGTPLNDFAASGFDGSYGEVRFLQYSKDANTILTEYRNQSSPGTFYTLFGGVLPAAPSSNTGIGNPTGTVTHSSGDLTADDPVFGNGGGDIKVGTKTGNTNQLQCASGAAGAAGQPLVYDVNGNAVAGTFPGSLPFVVLVDGIGLSYDAICTVDQSVTVDGALLEMAPAAVIT